MVDQSGPTGGGLAAGGWAVSGGSLLMSLHLLAGLFFFSYGIDALIFAWQVPEYSHGPIIPLLSLYMFMREMKSVPPSAGPVTDRAPGVAVVILAILVGLLGLLVRIPDIVTYAMILWIGGTVLTLFGARRGWYFWPSVLHLIFMLPLPNFIYWPLSIWLQMVSSRIGVDVISALGIPVFLDGNVIDLGVYRLQVAEACSGLRYLFPVMSFSYVFGVLYTGPRWHKIVLLLSAAPITVLMNSLRIGIIGVTVDLWGIEMAEGFLHAFEGWVIFIACVAILFGLAAGMQRLQPDPKPLSESIDLDFDGLGAQIRRYLAIPVTTGLIAALGVTALAAAVWQFTPKPQPVVPERAPLVQFPNALGSWESVERPVSSNILQVLRADDYLGRTYINQTEREPVDLWIAYYDKLTEGSGIHSPEVCLPSGGWEVNAWQRAEITIDDGTVIPVNRAIIRKGSARQMVYYYFQQAGRRLTSDYAAKFYTVVDSLTSGRTEGALVRLITPLAAGESEAEGAERLRRMLGLAIPELRMHLPE
ncbi:hypothetical protein LNKW23_24700 [Paralimibaculum aggregatum]|uniref:Methanolan biosynthesis EpsI domain-containing protein n=1 Tax=Paralimibaculum aggregatum TaxID=3036245 RepID=A0ABQ6LNH5_9RHOB|nr:VPLPA-CTERM-specific exosortase XrtD [Limibaculum sp. NKW23]GMG83257.1 hypothetical protein LNKW23_24700 [Limibaculum sp. NKW23]